MNGHADDKEIRLFGERSIKEEAYRQKVIQLEKEIMKLQAMLKEPGEKPVHRDIESQHVQDRLAPEYSEGLFYEQAVSMDEKAKGHLKMLEKKAQEISERLHLQAQGFIEPAQKTTRSVFKGPYIYILAAIILISSLLSVSATILVLKITQKAPDKNVPAAASLTQPDRIKDIIHKRGFYANQYTIISLNSYNQSYRAITELHFKPISKWSLKVLAQEIIDNFKSLVPQKAIQLDFIFDGKTYAKVNYSPVSDRCHFNFLIKE